MNCPICGSSKTKPEERFREGVFYRCGDCRVVFTHPMRAGSREYYEESYGALAGGYSEKKWEFREVFNSLDSLGFRTGKLLEVACGPGWFLKMAEKKGYDVYGIDFNGQAVAYAKTLGLKNVLVGDIGGGFEKLGQKFDFVVLIHILEHVEDPNRLLNQIKEALSDEGVIIIDLPNERRTELKFNLRKRREGWDYPPHHLTRWNADSLSNFLATRGFKTIYLNEERISSLAQVLNFVLGLIQINTATGLATVAGQERGDKHPHDGKLIGHGLILFLSRLKRFLSLILGLILLPPIYILSRVFYIRGTNLFIVAQLK
ncbi:MAG: Methyltransferase type 12 [Candidatus Jorgensenbacteria bacterium GW2011_GWA1_48_11]|uniref:Methyltransferase type 12 n=1 Tax=Candidatus Jorgensenbacteria bacterium GW2011_GWA1_48_11 TaxID=1618660 RepID=A0A0G1XAW8_9BACT|nr:MAG: Methyltransferase type 12 [Candidatus Jorgensenbacteria bacterium GW2011_GWA1_48_11]KKW11978.1 MAG: Methyltransferase type 12 [Candidatus Jorgensenbacteria bacterium GW2011_GWB1_49_9]